MRIIFLPAILVAFTALAQEQEETPAPVVDPAAVATATVGDRAPAQDNAPARHSEDELKVMPQLPDAQLKRDARSMQNEVYKSIYNRELKQDQREDVLDE